MTPEQFLKKLEEKKAEIVQLMNRTLPIKAGVMAKAHFQDNFRQGGFVNGGLQKWKPAKRTTRIKTGKRGKPLKKQPARNRYKTLMSSRNHLYGSIKHVPGNGEVKIINEAPYAKVHNEGLRAGRGKGFRMPKRRFIGESKELNDKVSNLIETEVNKVLNS